MRRLFRWLKLAVSLLSIMAFGLVLYAWPSSDVLWHDGGYVHVNHASGTIRYFFISSAEGKVLLSVVTAIYPQPISTAAARSGFSYQSGRSMWAFSFASLMQIHEYGRGLGNFQFVFHRGIPYGTDHNENALHIAIPHWFALILLAVGPVWNLIGLLRRRKHRAGFCPNCSYDLRAHKPGDKCPECGALITIHS